MNALKNDIIYHLQNAPVKLTSKQRKIRQFLLEHVAEVGYMSLKELSVKAEVSEVSILNFCALYGFENYIEMREAFRELTKHYMENLFVENFVNQTTQVQQNELYHYRSEIIANHNEMIRNIDMKQLERCVQALLSSRDIFVLAHDMSKIAADYLARRLNYLHIRSQSMNLGDLDSVQMLLSNLGPEDTVVIFSFPPYFIPTGDVAQYVRRRGAKLIAITGGNDSPAVVDDGISFLCKAQNAYFFNSMSVPLHLVEIIVYDLAIQAGRKSEETINIINRAGNHLIYNQNRGGEQADDKTD